MLEIDDICSFGIRELAEETNLNICRVYTKRISKMSFAGLKKQFNKANQVSLCCFFFEIGKKCKWFAEMCNNVIDDGWLN